MTTLPSIHIDFILHYIILTSYYNTKNTFRSQVVTEQKMWKQKKTKKNENFVFNTHRFYTTLYHTHLLLQYKEHIQITSNHKTINVETKKKQKNENFAFNTHTFYTTLYHTHLLLQCKEHIQITSGHRTINVEIKNNRVNK